MSSERTVSRRNLLKAAGGALLLSKVGLASTPDGLSTTTPSYVLPSAEGVELKAILTVGDAADNGYRMVGIPDGLGALRTGKTFSVFMNHEIPAGGNVRAHGRNGAFVSKWTIDRDTLQVIKGEDLTASPNDVRLWDPLAAVYYTSTTTWSRLCSADLPDPKALREGMLGTFERIFFDGEEVTSGRAWARIATGPNAGQAWELPRMGKMSFENVVACPHGKEKTIVVLTDDGNINPAAAAADNPSEVFIYVGTKQARGIEIDKAGLTNGRLYGVRVSVNGTPVSGESDEFGLGNATTGFVGAGTFELVEVGPAGNVSGLSALQLEQDAIAKNVFRMQRPEDSAWDPRESSPDLYFVTTASIDPLRNSRLWRLKFNDIGNPTKGGTIEILLTNTAGRMFDNLTIDNHGRVLMQEDTGNSPWVSRIWLYGIDTGEFIEVAHHDPELFQPGVNPAKFITQDEESSGIIDAEEVLGRGWFIFDVQNHKPNPDPELLEGGQLLALYVPPKIGRARQHPREEQHQKS